MPLVLALKNRQQIVVASDSPVFGHASTEWFGALMPLPNRCALLLSGNIEAIRSVVMETVLPHVTPAMGAAALAQVMHAALVLEVVPKLARTKGRIEVIVAGIDPVRHIEQPGLYYLDSAQDFRLQVVTGDAVMAGATAARMSRPANNDDNNDDMARRMVTPLPPQHTEP